MGAVSGGLVAVALFLNHAFDTSNDKRIKGMRIVALTIVFFVAATFLMAGMTCAPIATIRGEPAVFGDVEVTEINLQMISHDVSVPVFACVALPNSN